MSSRPENRYAYYHAHVYFNAATQEQAVSLCQRAGSHFDVRAGRVHCKRVGPHPCWSCQLAFESQTFDSLIPWLESNRDGLDILVHGVTGDDWADHTRHAM
ncbi:DOPA 4,5-dioxygenase family protein [Halomonas shantousis]